MANVDPAGAPPALVTGQFSAIAGYAQGQVPSVEIRGNKKTRIFWYADCGVIAVSNGIVVHNDLIKEDPALIRAFVSASIKGFLYGRQHPDEMVAIIRKFSQAVDPTIARREAELSWDTWVTPNTAGKPLGWMSDKDWEGPSRCSSSMAASLSRSKRNSSTPTTSCRAAPSSSRRSRERTKRKIERDRVDIA